MQDCRDRAYQYLKTSRWKPSEKDNILDYILGLKFQKENAEKISVSEDL